MKMTKQLTGLNLLRKPFGSIFIFVLSLLITLIQYNALGQCTPSPFACAGPTTVSAITTTTATFSGSAGTYNGAGPSGFVWGLTSGPTTTANAGNYTGGSVGVNTSSPYTYNVTGLTAGITYFVRAYVIDAWGNPTYGTEASFSTTPAGPVGIITATTTDININSATNGGTLTLFSGSQTITERGVVYSTSPSPTTGTGTKVISGSGYGTYSSSLIGLIGNTTYYVRAYAIDNNGVTYYGNDDIFTTSYPVAKMISPYAMPPKWMVGKLTGMTFGGSAANFTAGAPSTITGNPANNSGQEATVTMCDTSKNIVLYCNNSQIYNGSNGLLMNVNGNNGHSSTQGAVSFADPASPADQFYVFSGNDITGGNGGGINWFLFKNTAGTLSRIDGGPAAGNALTSSGSTVVSEALTVGTDNSGGYWVVGHGRNTEYKAWHVTTTGVTSAPVLSTGTASGGGGTAAIRISPCQNKIAFNSQPGTLEVYTWDNSTGKIGTLIQTAPCANGYGVEFSSGGNQVYYTQLHSSPTLYQIDLTTGAVTNLGTVGCGSWMGGLSLGPDGKIYSANGNSTCNKVGVVDKPNNSGAAALFDNVGFTLSTGNTHIGLANEPWLYPNLPNIYNTISCNTVNFSYDFKTYFRDNIDTSKVEWDFGSGIFTGRGATPSKTYSNGAYTVRLRVTDSLCHQQWTKSININISCAMPVSWLNVSAVTKGNVVVVNWATTMEKNNDYFEVQRSTDGIHFITIGIVDGKGNTSALSQYQFIDSRPNLGENYYRIVQYDFNKDYSTSNIVSAEISSDLLVQVVPNPSSKDFSVKVYGAEEATIIVLDILGREVYSNTFNTMNNLTFGENLAKGTYIIKIVSEEKVYTQKVVKQ